MSETIKLSDLQPDNHNANKGTERGRSLLEKSLHQYGAGRSILLDKNGRIIAGNKTAQTAGEIGIDDVIVVRTKGDKLVAVLREDLDITEESGRMMAYADNRTAEVDLAWDAEALLADITAGLPLDEFWFEWELDRFATEQPEDNEWGDAMGGLPDEDRAPFQQMTFTLHDTQVEQVKTAVSIAKSMGAFDSQNENSNGNALARICETFITDYGQS